MKLILAGGILFAVGWLGTFLFSVNPVAGIFFGVLILGAQKG